MITNSSAVITSPISAQKYSSVVLGAVRMPPTYERSSIIAAVIGRNATAAMMPATAMPW